MRTVGFGAALCLVAAMAAGVVPLSLVAQPTRRAPGLEERSPDWPPSTSIKTSSPPSVNQPPVRPPGFLDPLLPPRDKGPPFRDVLYLGSWVLPRSSVPYVDAVIGSQIHPGVRRCYERARDAGPYASGRLSVVLHVGPSGDVDSATTEGKDRLPGGLASCVASVARRATFSGPGLKSATVRATFDFVDDGF